MRCEETMSEVCGFGPIFLSPSNAVVTSRSARSNKFNNAICSYCDYISITQLGTVFFYSCYCSWVADCRHIKVTRTTEMSVQKFFVDGSARNMQPSNIRETGQDILTSPRHHKCVDPSHQQALLTSVHTLIQ